MRLCIKNICTIKENVEQNMYQNTHKTKYKKNPGFFYSQAALEVLYCALGAAQLARAKPRRFGLDLLPLC
jgi:hypothetical protein